ncbi:MAG: hypothetical protein F4175_18025, partial [Gemmatimonadetes bacterium]|nr:hypothetical protein [Gemmatimonadota bacterium]
MSGIIILSCGIFLLVRMISFLLDLQNVLRDLHQFTVLKFRLVGDDAADRHIQGLSNVYKGVAIQQNRLDELAHQITVGTSMATGTDPWRKRWTSDGWRHLILLATSKLAVIGPLLRAYPASFPTLPRR